MLPSATEVSEESLKAISHDLSLQVSLLPLNKIELAQLNF